MASSFIFGAHIALTVEAALEMFFPSSVGNYIAFLATLLMWWSTTPGLVPRDCPLTTEVLDRSHDSQEEEENDITGQSISGIRQEQAWKQQTTFTAVYIIKTRDCLCWRRRSAALTLSDDQAEGEQQVENKVEWR